MRKCSSCGEVSDQQFEACWSCGSILDESSTEVEPKMAAAEQAPGHSERQSQVGESRPGAKRWGTVLSVLGSLLMGTGFGLAALFALIASDYRHGVGESDKLRFAVVTALAMLVLAGVGRQINRAGRRRNPNMRRGDWVVGLLSFVIAPLAIIALITAVIMVGLGGVK